MRLMHLMGGGDVGGAKTHIMSLVKELSKHNEVILVSFREGAFPEEARQEGIDVRVIPELNFSTAVNKLVKLIDDFKPDIVHCHGARANIMGAGARLRRKVPTLTTVHSDYKLDYMDNKFRDMTIGKTNAVALRKLDYTQPVADRMARTLIERGFDPEKMFVIYNGMDFSNPCEPFERAGFCKERWNVDIEEGDVLCGIAARLTPVKDIFTLLKGFAKALENAPQLRLFIAGEGSDEEALKKLSESLGIAERVVFCGWVKDINRFYAAMDITVLSSLSETFPYSILEGVKEGCAAICSDVGGMSELIDSGENGFIFEPKDHEQLALYLSRLANDNELRRSFAEKLYKKASREYSLDNMRARQEANYEMLLKKFRRVPSKKDSIVICGAYGKGNAGDDAILTAIVQEMKEIDPLRPIVVMTRRPMETKLAQRTGAVYTFNILKVLRELKKAQLYINGGGSLIQDVTSTRSLQYYLYTLKAAKKRGCRVMMYGCGIGPVNKPSNRKTAAEIIDKYVDLITLRDDISRTELIEMGVKRPEVIASADPTVILRPASREYVKLVLEQMGIDPEKNYIGFGMRNWSGFDRATAEIAAAADYAYEKHGLIPLFVPIEFPSDLEPAQIIGEKLSCPYHVITKRQPIEVTIGILASMKTVIGIRLHSLMFSAVHGVPVIGVSYDIKVDGFLKYIDSKNCVHMEDVRREELFRLIDECVSGAQGSEVKRTKEMLLEREQENPRGAKKLLER